MPQTARPAAPGDNPDADEARAAYRAPARAAAEAELGGNELDATVKVCRACQNGAQRLYHIGRLGRVAVEAASAPGARCVPPELVAQLAQDDDGEVRAAAAGALPGLATAAASLPEPRSAALALVLLDAAFELVEDDVEAVVAAAEAALPALATALLRPEGDPATAVGALGEPLARLAASEEEEVRASAARLAGALAAPLGPALAASHMLPLASAAAEDASFRVRKAAAGALALLAPALGGSTERRAAAERCLSTLDALSHDSVWTVRKAAAEALPAAAAAPALPPAAAAEALLEALPRLCADSGVWVRNAALCALGPALVVLARCGGAVPDELLSEHYAAAAAGDETGAATADFFCEVAQALGARARWPQLWPAFTALARSPDRAIRAAAAAALPRLAALIADPAAVAAALGGAMGDALGDPAPEVQVAALNACVDFVALIPEDRRGEYLPLVCALATPPAVPAAAAAAGVPCGVWRVREAASRALAPLAAAEAAVSRARGALAAETALSAALAACRDPVAAVRTAASAAAAPLLAAAAGDGEASAIACDAMRQLGSSPDYLLRLSFVAACDALAGLACAGAVPARQLLLRELAPLLLSLSEDAVASVRCALAAALGRHSLASGGWEAAGLGAGSAPRAALGKLATDYDAETRRVVGAARVAAAAAAAAAPSVKPGAGARKMPLKVGLLQRRSAEPPAASTGPKTPPKPVLGAAAAAAEGSGSAPVQPAPRAASPPQRGGKGGATPSPPAGKPGPARPRPVLQPGLLQRRSLGSPASPNSAAESPAAAAAALRRVTLGVASDSAA